MNYDARVGHAIVKQIVPLLERIAVALEKIAEADDG